MDRSTGAGVVTRIEVVGELEALESAWRELADRSGNVFASWEWLHTWWAHFGRGRALRCVLCRDGDGRAIAIWPLYVARLGPLRVLRLMGHGPTDQLGPVCDPRDRDVATRALQKVIEDGRLAFDLFIADELPSTTDWTGMLGATRLGDQDSPTVVFGTASWDAWFAARSRNFRAQARRRLRDLGSIGEVSFRCTDRPDDVATDMAILRRLHDARWEGGSRSFTGREAFHDDVGRQLLDQGWLRLRFLEVDGRPVAALYNLVFGEAESFYQGGRDPAFAAHSVGFLLHLHAIEAAMGEGRTEYRMLRGAETYKARFTNRTDSLVSFSVTGSTLGRVAEPAVARVGALPRWAIRRVPAPVSWKTGGTPTWGRS